MSGPVDEEHSAWCTARLAASLLAIDPRGLGGIQVKAPAGPVRDGFWAYFETLLPKSTPVRRVPVSTGDDRLLGGLDLAATLASGKPVMERGLLACADGGFVLLPSAERLQKDTAAHITTALDQRQVVIERDGMSKSVPAAFGIIAFDESKRGEDAICASLRDRLAFSIVLDGLGLKDIGTTPHGARDDAARAVVRARARLNGVVISDAAVEALCGTAESLGVASARALAQSVNAAKALAAMADRSDVTQDDLGLAAALVLAPRATCVPDANTAEDAAEPHEGSNEPAEAPDGVPDDHDPEHMESGKLDDMVLNAAMAALPEGLLDQLQPQTAANGRAQSSGRAGVLHLAKRRGRPAGVRAGRPVNGARLNILETLRAAAPWQRVRQRLRAQLGLPPHDRRRIDVRPQDFRVTRFKERSETTTIFVVDASGSLALHRLAEAKGAVELMLSECYVRRDSVALIAFRGTRADVIVPPTRSLTRAKRCLIALPAGGGTPLATAICAAGDMALGLKQKGQTPAIVLLTDGKANISRQGTQGRAAAQSDALASAAQLRSHGISSILIDTFAHREPKAEAIALAMGARYLPLPYADAQTLSEAVRNTVLGRNGRAQPKLS